MTIDRETLEARRAEHWPFQAESGVVACRFCPTDGNDGMLIEWPCEDSQILDLALKAERLRAALEEIRAECGNKPREWTKEIATVALGRD